MAIDLFSESERAKAEGQGSKKVPSNHQGQVFFGFGQVTFPASLSDGQGYEQAAAFTGFKKTCENKKLINFGVVVPKINKTFSV